MSREKINSRLQAAKEKIQKIQNNMNREPTQEQVTKNACPPVAEPPDDKNMNEPDVPGFITGGPKRSNKYKQV